MRPGLGSFTLVATMAVGAAVPSGAVAGQAAPEAGEPDPARERAIAEVKKARAAASKGNWKKALGHFEEAMRLKPSPKLHYSIAVCHHRMSLEMKEGSEERKAAEVAAIDAYQRHLDENPGAPNEAEVKQTIAALGGDAGGKAGVERVPVEDYSDAWAAYEDEPVEPATPDPGPDTDPEADPADPEAPGETTDGDTGHEPPPPRTPPEETTPEKPEPKPARRRARVGAAFVSTITHPVDALRSRSAVDIPLGAGLLLHGGAYLGQRKQLSLGGEVGISGGIPTRLDRHGVLLAHLGIGVDYGWVLGKSRRVEITAGGLVGVAFESLRERDTPADPVSCPVTDGREVSRRGGLLGAVRPGVWVLLGRNRNHMIGLRVAAAMLVMADGESSDTDRSNDPCEDPSPFKEVGLHKGFGFGLISDLGYALRF